MDASNLMFEYSISLHAIASWSTNLHSNSALGIDNIFDFYYRGHSGHHQVDFVFPAP